MENQLSLSDTELTRMFIKGDEQAFKMLYQRYHKRVFAIVLFYVKEKALAEDMTQDVFIKVFTGLKAFRYSEEGKFISWLQRIAHNHCMDYLRRPKRTQYVSDFSTTSLVDKAAQSPEYKIVKEEKAKQLHSFINKLSDEQKEVLHYRHFEDLSFKEIAVLTNANLNTTLGRMRYALIHLRTMAKVCLD